MIRMIFVISLVGLLGFLHPFMPAADGQTRLNISVWDASEAKVPGAEIRISKTANDTQPVRRTDKEGFLTVDIPPGSYDVYATSPGFRRSKQHVDLHEGEIRTLKFVLVPGSCPPGPCLTVGPEVKASPSH
jgi:hypothetical protein